MAVLSISLLCISLEMYIRYALPVCCMHCSCELQSVAAEGVVLAAPAVIVGACVLEARVKREETVPGGSERSREHVYVAVSVPCQGPALSAHGPRAGPGRGGPAVVQVPHAPGHS